MIGARSQIAVRRVPEKLYLRRESERGSVLVESALILSVFLISWIAVFDLGQLFFFQVMIADRVRAGLRYAVVSTYDPAAITNVVVYNSPVPSQTGSGLFGLKSSMVAVSRTSLNDMQSIVTISVSGFPLALYGPLLSGTTLNQKFQAVAIMEGAGASR